MVRVIIFKKTADIDHNDHPYNWVNATYHLDDADCLYYDPCR